MNMIWIEIIITALLVAINCSLLGTLLVLRGVALMSDAISHAVLLGIALLFLYTHNLNSPLLLLGAAVAGVATVYCTEALIQTEKIKKDTAIGLVFPLFFSLGVIIISKYAAHAHLDVDMVLLGEVAFAPFNRLTLGQTDCGPYAWWTLGTILLANVLFLVLFYKELVVTIFDKQAAALMGYRPTLLYYALMGLTSMTIVASFNIIGSIVVVALIITPPATALLITHDLFTYLLLAIAFSCYAVFFGTIAAYAYNVSIAGAIATISGMIFFVTLVWYRRFNKPYL